MVDRCVCRNVPFTELKKLADAGIRDVDELSGRTGCGTGCGMCIPYIRVMLKTGVTDLPVLFEKQIDAILNERDRKE
ncbi:MAG: (2Fe-2S)-binding protein [Phycisphaerales bacterium]